jgi:kinesin family protein C2/C3
MYVAGSGKTYTMEGNEESRGVNYRALDSLFAIRDERKSDMQYDISVSMLEIYNEVRSIHVAVPSYKLCSS